MTTANIASCVLRRNGLVLRVEKHMGEWCIGTASKTLE